MTVKLETNQLRRIADTAEIDRDHVRIDYSGRFMYGERCVGFDLDDAAETMLLGAAIFKELPNELAVDMINNVRQDNMGMGIIVYFPGFQCDEWEGE